MVETGSLIKMLPSRVMRCTQLDCVGLAAQSDLSEDDCRNNRNEYSGLHTEKYLAPGSVARWAGNPEARVRFPAGAKILFSSFECCSAL